MELVFLDITIPTKKKRAELVEKNCKEINIRFYSRWWRVAVEDAATIIKASYADKISINSLIVKEKPSLIKAQLNQRFGSRALLLLR
jgi:imidazole glycerol phosphate synthase subunit HisF